MTVVNNGDRGEYGTDRHCDEADLVMLRRMYLLMVDLRGLEKRVYDLFL
jgi:hypothetical protein